MHDDLLAADAIADPYRYFGELRAKDPVHWNERWGGWILTRYDDIVKIYKDPRVSSDRVSYLSKKLCPAERETLAPSLSILSDWIVFVDPPKHTRLRQLVSKAFGLRRIAELRPRVERLVDTLLEPIVGAGDFDLIADFAYPLPVTVIAELIGVPHEDNDLLNRWSKEIALVIVSALDVDDRHSRSQQALLEFSDYLREFLERRRIEPGDDVISTLIAAKEDGVQLSDEEIIATCSMILFAGHETTTNLIANGVLALLRNPDQLTKLNHDPSLIPSAVEECLRYDCPAKAITRIAGEELEVGGKRIEKGQRMLLVQGAGNRDPDVFPDPDRFDITRDPNPHLAFARGPHFCLGAPLARLEMEVVLERLFRRLPTLRITTEEVKWQPVIITRSLDSLPLRC